MKHFLSNLTAIALLFILHSCTNLLSEPVKVNDNAVFYGTEWSNEKKAEGVKFYKDNSVLFFASGVRSKGTFQYDASTKYMTFEGGELYFSSWTCVNTGAYLVDDNTLILYWHPLGEDEKYQQTLYKR